MKKTWLEKIWLGIRKIIIWIASVFEDKTGSVSSKRVGLFIILWIFDKNLTNGIITHETIWPFIVLIAATMGLTLPEWFSKLKTNE